MRLILMIQLSLIWRYSPPRTSEFEWGKSVSSIFNFHFSRTQQRVFFDFSEFLRIKCIGWGTIYFSRILSIRFIESVKPKKRAPFSWRNVFLVCSTSSRLNSLVLFYMHSFAFVFSNKYKKNHFFLIFFHWNLMKSLSETLHKNVSNCSEVILKRTSIFCKFFFWSVKKLDPDSIYLKEIREAVNFEWIIL